MSRIVQQYAALSYSPFLALPAPKIAGLLPAPKPIPPLKPFVYAEPGLAALPEALRNQFDHMLRTLLDAVVGLLADERDEAEFSLASGTFLRQISALYHSSISGDPKPAVESPFARARQRLDARIEELQAQSRVHMAETRERIARELAAMRTEGW